MKGRKNVYSTMLTMVLAFCIGEASGGSNADSFKFLELGSEMLKNNQTAFEENKGQVSGEDSERVKYVFKDKGLSIFLLNDGITYQYNQIHYAEDYAHAGESDFRYDWAKREESVKNTRIESYRMDVVLDGGNPNPLITATGKSNDYVQYYNHDVLNVHSYSEITYHNVYPDIDWVIYKTPTQLKYNFVVRPGGNPSLIKLKTKWVENIVINKDGSLTLRNCLGQITEDSPVSFQGEKVVATKFELNDNIISFNIGNYNPNNSLIIDPDLLWSTYYGGSDWERGSSSVVDSLGNVYLSGRTKSNSFIAFGGHQNNSTTGVEYAFLVKFNSIGERQWATYYGGNIAANDKGIIFTTGESCAVDGVGNVYLAGSTTSYNSIASIGHQNNIGGMVDGYLVKFNAAGVRQWATYYGGAVLDYGASCATDNFGNAYLAGSAESINNISFGGHQSNYGGHMSDAYLVKFNSAGVRLWGTFYGGSAIDQGNSCATDGLGNVYLAGGSTSTLGIAYEGHQNNLGGSGDAFLVKFNSNGIRQWATYYGGNEIEWGSSCVVDGSNNVFLAGRSNSSSLVASLGFQNNHGGDYDAFLVKFNPNGNRQWATYYGGNEDDRGLSCAVDSFGNVYLVGYTESNVAISFEGYQNTLSGSRDAFLVKFNSSGSREWATYFGGNDEDDGLSCAVDNLGDVFLAGNSQSTSVAFEGHQNNLNGIQDAFLAKFEGGGGALWVQDVANNDGFDVYPNPSNGQFKIVFNESKERIVSVYDLLGKLIFNTTSMEDNIEINLGKFAAGNYLLQIQQEDAIMNKTIIVSK
jgi:hypothetical protein